MKRRGMSQTGKNEIILTCPCAKRLRSARLTILLTIATMRKKTRTAEYIFHRKTYLHQVHDLRLMIADGSVAQVEWNHFRRVCQENLQGVREDHLFPHQLVFCSTVQKTAVVPIHKVAMVKQIAYKLFDAIFTLTFSDTHLISTSLSFCRSESYCSTLS